MVYGRKDVFLGLFFEDFILFFQLVILVGQCNFHGVVHPCVTMRQNPDGYFWVHDGHNMSSKQLGTRKNQDVSDLHVGALERGWRSRV